MRYESRHLSYERRRLGFTLIELLVVIAIIAILAAILFPVFARAREQARMSVCSSNFKQYSNAFLMYIQDYDETFPMWHINVPFKPGELNLTTWDLSLQTYIRSFGVSRCPSDPTPAFFEFKDGSTIWRSYTTPRNLIWDTSVPGWPFPANHPRAAFYPMRLPFVTRPSDTIMMFEKNQGVEVNGWPYPVTRRPAGNAWFSADAFENFQQVAWERHGDRVNALFVDGHVKPVHGRRQGAFRYPPQKDDTSYYFPPMDGYVYRPGAGALLDKKVNGPQFWEDCPIPGETPNSFCPP